jgi:hypothetical protein
MGSLCCNATRLLVDLDIGCLAPVIISPLVLALAFWRFLSTSVHVGSKVTEEEELEQTEDPELDRLNKKGI